MIKIHLNPTAAEQQLRAAEAALAGLCGIAVLKEMKAVFFAQGWVKARWEAQPLQAAGPFLLCMRLSAWEEKGFSSLVSHLLPKFRWQWR